VHSALPRSVAVPTVLGEDAGEDRAFGELDLHFEDLEDEELVDFTDMGDGSGKF
jgi:hypothetical protein